MIIFKILLIGNKHVKDSGLIIIIMTDIVKLHLIYILSRQLSLCRCNGLYVKPYSCIEICPFRWHIFSNFFFLFLFPSSKTPHHALIFLISTQFYFFLFFSSFLNGFYMFRVFFLFICYLCNGIKRKQKLCDPLQCDRSSLLPLFTSTALSYTTQHYH